MESRFLAPLFQQPGSVASVYVDTTRASESAAEEIGLQRRALRHDLSEQRADADTLSALDTVVGRHEEVPGRTGQAVFAAHGNVVLDRVLPHPPRREIARWASLPHAMPLAAQAPATLPHVVAVVDRTGADIAAYGPQGETAIEREVKGKTYPIQTDQGGWSQARYQRRAEKLWEHNAAEVADEINRLVVS